MKTHRPTLALPPIGHEAPPDTASPNWPVCAALLIAIVILASGIAARAYDLAVAAFALPADRYAVSFKIEARWCEDQQPNACGQGDFSARLAQPARDARSNLRAPAGVSLQEARR